MSAAREETAEDPMDEARPGASSTALIREEAAASSPEAQTALPDQTPAFDAAFPPIKESASATALAGFRRVAAALMIADALCIVGALLVIHGNRLDGGGLPSDFVF